FICTLQAQDIFVSPLGDDLTGDGSITNPFATINQAKLEVRSLIAAGLTQPVNVNVRAGTYPQSSPIVFGVQDGGTAAFPITYQAYQNEDVIISGATEITGWTQDGDRWVADAPGLSRIRAFYKSDAILTLAQTPNRGEYFRSNGPGSPTEDDGKRSFFQRPADQIPAAWANGEVDVVIFQLFKQPRHDLASVQGNLLTITPDERRVLGFADYAFNYFFDNHIDMLDAPGEWYHDVTNEQIYYYLIY
ncbi:MAG: hypothetical protein AAF840_17800, partial [Bacteroidota bacterium]